MGKRAITKEHYEEMCTRFSIDVPEFYNFGFDVIDARAEKDRNKPAMFRVSQKGEEKNIVFPILPTSPTRQQILCGKNT